MNNIKKAIKLNLSFNLIQEIRLAQALMESKYFLCIDKNQAYKFAILRKKFNVNYILDNCGKYPCLTDVIISHKTPLTRVGKIKKILVFPRGIFNYLHDRWPQDRKYDFTFVGLLTKQRKKFFSSWFKKFQNNKIFSVLDNSAKLIFRRILFRFFNIPIFKIYTINRHNILFCISNRGRKFPLKSWDDKYYEILLNSKFILCPEGDCSWSYRFFEAIICGAIPIVEYRHSAYEGFFFYEKDDDPERMQWRQDMAEKNFQLCHEILTIPIEELNNEISNLLRNDNKCAQ